MAERIPLVLDGSILDILNYLKVHVTSEELRKPCAFILTTVFNSFLNEFTFNLDYIDTPPLHAQEFIQHPDLCEESLPLVSFWILMSYLMQACGFPDFSIRDILEPKPKRTRRILSYVIHFWKYACGTFEMYQPLEEVYRFSTEERNKMLQSIANVKCELDEKAAFIEDGQNEFIQKRELAEQLKALFEETEQEQKETSMRAQALKHSIAEKVKRMNDTQLQIASLQERNLELDQQIIKSPDRLKLELEQFQQKCSKVKEMEENLVAVTARVKKQFEMQNNTQEPLTVALDSGKEFSEELNKVRNSIFVMTEKRNLLKPDDQAVSKNAVQLSQKEEKLSFLDSKAMKENMHYQKSCTVLKEAGAERKRELEKMKESQHGKFRQIKFEERKQELQQQLEQVNDSFVIFGTKVKSTFNSIRNRVLKAQEDYNNELDSVTKFFHSEMKRSM